MALPFTPAPINERLNNDVKTSPAWVSWFKLVRLYIQGFYAESAASTDILVNTTYIADSASLVTFTVPDRFDINDVIQVIGKGAGGWKVQLNSGQTITGNGTTTSGGSLASTNRYDSVTLKGISATQFAVISKVGTLTYA